MAERPPILSVLVTSFNQLPTLRVLVPQLLDQDCNPESYELVIVDDGSSDGTRPWLQGIRDSRLVLLLNERNLGRAASRNRGVRACRGDVIVMLDGDHSVSGDFLSAHARHHERERCVVVGRSVYETHPDFRAINHYLDNCGAAKLPSETRLPGRYFLTRNCSLPRDLLHAVGLFDEQFRAWGGEDLDLGVRLEQSGVPIYGEPRALAVHHHLRPLNELLDNLYVYGRDGIPVLLARHPRLFTELNLHRLFHGPHAALPRTVRQWLMELLMSAPVYYPLRFLANSLRRFRLPRLLIDYLHLRQYSRGFAHHLKQRMGD